MVTKIKLTNKNQKKDAKTYITLGATIGCIQDVGKIIFSNPDIKITKLADLQGWFLLKAGTSTEIKAPEGDGFNGNISYDTPPMNCKSDILPFGCNLAEFIVNNGFQDGNPQETIDISGVSGANAQVTFTMDTDDWAANSGAIPVTTFENQEWDKNTGITGVYPYGCDKCTASVQPPACVGLQPQNVNKHHICNVQRNAKSNKGGMIEIQFIKYFEEDEE